MTATHAHIKSLLRKRRIFSKWNQSTKHISIQLVIFINFREFHVYTKYFVIIFLPLLFAIPFPFSETIFLSPNPPVTTPLEKMKSPPSVFRSLGRNGARWTFLLSMIQSGKARSAGVHNRCVFTAVKAAWHLDSSISWHFPAFSSKIPFTLPSAVLYGPRGCTLIEMCEKISMAFHTHLLHCFWKDLLMLHFYVCTKVVSDF